MNKRIISSLFTFLFVVLITAPSIIIVLDDSVDTSIFYSLNEEEENGKAKNIISPFALQSNDITSTFTLKNYSFYNYKFKNYPKPHLNLISPPPEQNTL
jgi:hypothetical protein